MKIKSITILSALVLLAGLSPALACELCKKNQPKILENITHGTGPTGTLDYIIIWSAVVLVSITMILSIKFLAKPEETNADHIKNIVLNQNN